MTIACHGEIRTPKFSSVIQYKKVQAVVRRTVQKGHTEESFVTHVGNTTPVGEVGGIIENR